MGIGCFGRAMRRRKYQNTSMGKEEGEIQRE
jgi:hypothetical protein